MDTNNEILILLKAIGLSTERRLNAIVCLLVILVLISSIFAMTVCYCSYLN